MAGRLLERAVFVRELLPQDLKIDLETLTREEAIEVSGYLAHVVGAAHAAQLDKQARKGWLSELGKSRTKSLDAPSWLWRSVGRTRGFAREGLLRALQAVERRCPSVKPARRSSDGDFLRSGPHGQRGRSGPVLRNHRRPACGL